MSPRLPSLHQPPVGFGHAGAVRGSQDLLSGIRLTTQSGATGIHAGVWLTADGVPVLHHDGRVGSRLRRSKIHDVDAAALGKDAPTLADCYREMGPGLAVSLDVNVPEAFDQVVALARSIGQQAEQNLWLSHPDVAVLTRWRGNTDAHLINSVRVQSLPNGLERRAAELQQLGIDGLALFHTEWNGGKIALLHRFDRLALGRGARFERELAALVDAGIDGVYSEHPDRMMAVIAEYYPPAEPADGGRE